MKGEDEVVALRRIREHWAADALEAEERDLARLARELPWSFRYHWNVPREPNPRANR